MTNGQRNMVGGGERFVRSMRVGGLLSRIARRPAERYIVLIIIIIITTRRNAIVGELLLLFVRITLDAHREIEERRPTTTSAVQSGSHDHRKTVTKNVKQKKKMSKFYS